MTTEILRELEDFEIFVEKFEKFVEEIKTLVEKTSTKIGDYKLHSKDGYKFSIPEHFFEYVDIYKQILDEYDEYLIEEEYNPSKVEIWGMENCFFNLYYNDKEINSTFIVNKTFNVKFIKDKILYNI